MKVIDGGTPKAPEYLYEARKGHETRIAFVEKDGQKWATEVILKGPVKVAKEDLVNFEFVRKQVEKPDANVVLIDSRPLPRFQQGTIPGAINIPYPAWDKVAAKLLPADKSKQLVFFCQGVTCQMSPLSQRKAIGDGLQEHQGLSRGRARVADEGLPRHAARVRQGGLRRQGHPVDHPRRPRA